MSGTSLRGAAALRLSDGTEVPATGQAIDQDGSALVRFDGNHISELQEFTTR